jgi:hypothetical protein
VSVGIKLVISLIFLVNLNKILPYNDLSTMIVWPRFTPKYYFSPIPGTHGALFKMYYNTNYRSEKTASSIKIA